MTYRQSVHRNLCIAKISCYQYQYSVVLILQIVIYNHRKVTISIFVWSWCPKQYQISAEGGFLVKMKVGMSEDSFLVGNEWKKGGQLISFLLFGSTKIHFSPLFFSLPFLSSLLYISLNKICPKIPNKSILLNFPFLNNLLV